MNYPAQYEIVPNAKFDVTQQLPGSKSITNRALVLSAAGNGACHLSSALRSDDTEAAVEAMNALGARVRWSSEGVTVEAPLPDQPQGRVNCRDAGTVARFLPAIVAALGGDVFFDASAQLRARPMRQLLDTLQGLAVNAAIRGTKHLPFQLEAEGLRGGDVVMGGGVSSQFLSGVLMALPLARQSSRVEVRELVSRPYVDLTLGMMSDFGAMVSRDGYEVFEVESTGRYQTEEKTYAIEADASTASYFFAAAASTEGKVTVKNLGLRSLQGDARFVEILREMGAKVEQTEETTTVSGTTHLHGVEVDMGDISDVMMTLAAIAPLADSPTHISNVGHARHKESDRVAVMVKNLARCGIRCYEGPDWIRIYPGVVEPAVIDTAGDHRIAMSFAVLGLSVPGIVLDAPECVKKTCPDFFERWKQLEGK